MGNFFDGGGASALFLTWSETRDNRNKQAAVAEAAARAKFRSDGACNFDRSNMHRSNRSIARSIKIDL